MNFHTQSFHQNPQDHYFSFRDYDIILKGLEKLQETTRPSDIDWNRLSDLIAYFKIMKRNFKKNIYKEYGVK